MPHLPLASSDMTQSQITHDAIPVHYHWPDNNVTSVPNRRANASAAMLARNGDLSGMAKGLKQREDRFNKRFCYPHIFLNDSEAFTDQFQGVRHLFISVNYASHILAALATRRAGK